METVARDYMPKGVEFRYIYKALAHPETNGYITPFNLTERLMHVAEAKKKLGTQIPWICDTMKNDLKHALGDRPNSEFIIDPQGRVAVARSWSNPQQLRQDLERIIGAVERPTTVADLNMPTLRAPQKAPTGVVQRVSLPGQGQPLKIEPLGDDAATPHYAKLRAEKSGDKLYLGFFLDPLYEVHWNNKAPALKYTITPPQGVQMTPLEGTAAKPEVDADADPREFLIDVNGNSNDPIRVSVSYFACDDAETFCNRVTQEYLVTLQRDPDGGSRRGGGRSSGQLARNGGLSRPPQGANRNQAMMRQRMMQMILRMPVIRAIDKDGDGELSAEEIEAAPKSLLKVDRNGDGTLTRDELRPR